MNAEKQQIAQTLRRAGYRETKGFVAETEQLIANLPARPKVNRQDQVLKITSIAAVLALFLAFGMPCVVKAAEAIIGHLFSERAARIEQQLALPEDEKFKQAVEVRYDSSRTHALDQSTEFLGMTIHLTGIGLSPDDRYDTKSTKGKLSVNLEFSEIPSFDPNYMEFHLHFDGKDHPFVMEEAQKYFLEGGMKATPESWASWEGAGIGQMYGGNVPCADVNFALDDWRIEQATHMVLTGSIDGQTFELSFTYDPALALQEAEERARKSMPASEAYDKRVLDEMRQAAEGAGQVGYVKREGPIEFMVSELSLTGNELLVSMGYKGVTEKDPILAAHTYSIFSITIDGQIIGADSWDRDKVENGTYTSVARFQLPADMKLPEESLVYAKLRLGSKDGKTEHDFGDTSDYERFGYAAFRYNWRTKTATLPENAAQDAEWIAQVQQNEYFFDLPWTGKMMQRVDDGLEVSVMNVAVRDGKTIHVMPYASALRTWKHEFEGVEYSTDELRDAVFTVNGKQMPFSGIDYGFNDTLMFGLAGIAKLEQDDRCELSMPVRVLDKGESVYEGVFTFRFKLGQRKG